MGTISTLCCGCQRKHCPTLLFQFLLISVNPREGSIEHSCLLNTFPLVHSYRDLTSHWIWGKPDIHCHINAEWCPALKTVIGPDFISLLLLQPLRKVFILLIQIGNQIPSKGLPGGLLGCLSSFLFLWIHPFFRTLYFHEVMCLLHVWRFISVC